MSKIQKFERSGSLLSGLLLIAGTSIGAGMLALPVVTSFSGLIPSFLICTICWLFMMATGLLFLEATLWMKDGSNVLSMSKRFLGRSGEIVAGGSFVFLYYCLMIAYLSGGGTIFGFALKALFKVPFDPIFSSWMFGAVLAVVVAFGAKMIDRTNWICMVALAFAYFILIGTGIDDIQFSNLQYQNWGLILIAAPTLFSAFGYHNVIPSISTYLHRDRKKLRLAIIFGTTIPFIVYMFWQLLIMGIISQEVLTESEGTPIGFILQEITQNPWMSSLANFFAFFAIVTSVLGVSLSMVDFLGDGLKIRRTGVPRIGLTLLVFLPPLFVSAGNPKLFVTALGVAGGLGEALLNGLLPIALVWVGRYRFHLPHGKLLPGGKSLLIFLTLFSLLIMGVEIYLLING